MKENKYLGQRGITLIALAVTIIVLIILALVTIDATIGENGLFKKAQEMQDYLKNAQTADEEAINEVLEEMEGSTSSNNAGGEETNKEITVEVQASPTSSTITINASGSNAQGKIENGTYRYYIRKVEVGSEFSEKNGTGETCIIEELEQDTEYEIKVECEDEEGNIGSKTITVKTLKVTDADVEKGTITFDNLTWSNKQASITIRTNTEYIIEYQVNSTSGEWIRGSKISTIANGLHHGDIVNARLTDGTNSGDYTTYNVIDNTAPTITITKGAVTSNSITITVKGEDEESGMEESAKYRYYIKKQGEGDTSYKEKTGTGNSCTITGLEQETGYTVKVEVEDIAGNTGKEEENITTGKVTGGTEQGAITFDSLSWSNRQASVVIRTNTSYKIEYQVNGTNANNWTEGNTVATTVNGLHHGDIVNARLSDGINKGDYTSYNVIDNIVPIINSFTVENVTENSITVIVNAEDNESGLAESGTYAYYKNGSLVETSESNTCTYTGLTAQTEYELKVIVKDQGGKTAERIVKGTTSKKKSEIEQARDDGTIFDETTDLKDDEDNIIWIPKDFGIDEDSATNQDEGIVITDEIGNEFVWVPVPDPSTMFKTVEEPVTLSDGVTKTNKYSKLRVREGDRHTASIPGNDSRYSVREPDVLTVCDDNSSYIEELGYSDITEMAEDLVREYNEMAKSIETYHGFYIGRYELSGTKEKPAVKAGAVLTASSANMWYGLKKACQEVIKNNTEVKSTMIYGCQWDETMSWLKRTKFVGEEEKVDKDSSSWGNYKNSTSPANVSGYGSRQDTGYSEYWSANKIYDLAGNYYDWTQEAYDIDNRIDRGGNCDGSGSSFPGSDRLNGVPDNALSYFTARATLIISDTVS